MILAEIEYRNILKNKENYVLVDVRSLKEYQEATIPGAINIPIFSNEEYAQIGKCYKNDGKEAAIRIGISFIASKLCSIYEEFFRLRQSQKKIAIFCSRGGMRSSSLGAFLQPLGFNIIKIDKGYKGYRQFINSAFCETLNDFSFISLYGKTGTGKTLILNEIKKLGYTVLDLEKCANHRGSLLGGIGLGDCNSQKMFESLVFDIIYNSKYSLIFTEGESKRIGRIIMPDCLYRAISSGMRILINADIEKRVETIHQEYINQDTSDKEIIDAISSMEIYIGKTAVEEYVKSIRVKDYDYVIKALITKHYDNVYSTKDKNFSYEFINIDPYETAKNILKTVGALPPI